MVALANDLLLQKELRQLTGRAYQCYIWLCPEADGGFSALAPCLPGVASQGETQEEAVANITEAFRGVAESYLESGTIPWLETPDEDKPEDAVEKWILVNV